MIGSIAQLWRYPVKSMPGERIAESEVGTDGRVRQGDAVTLSVEEPSA